PDWNGRSAYASAMAERAPGLVEAVDAAGLGRHEDAIAGLDPHLAHGAHGHVSELLARQVEERVAADVLRNEDLAAPRAVLARSRDVLRPHADRGRLRVACRCAIHEIHLRRPDEAGDEEVGWTIVE